MRLTKILLVVTVSGMLSACITTETSSRRSAENNEDAAEQLYNLGSQYYRNGKYAIARDRLERAIQLDDNNADAHSMLALTYVQIGNQRGRRQCRCVFDLPDLPHKVLVLRCYPEVPVEVMLDEVGCIGAGE